jgi:hypothetical protein
MSRQEYKMIRRRMDRGRQLSLQSGNYIYSIPPYGYTRQGTILVPHPEEAETVKMIFDLYANENKGSGAIATILNSINIPSHQGGRWLDSVVRSIIKNPVYYGKICNKRRIHTKSKEAGKRNTTKNLPMKEWTLFDGKHEPLVSEETFNLAKSIKDNRIINRSTKKRPSQNPLSGLVFCSKCGYTMQRIRNFVRHSNIQLRCITLSCDTKSSQLRVVEERILTSIDAWLKNFEYKKSEEIIDKKNNAIEIYKKNIKAYNIETENLVSQRNKLYDLLERGIYDSALFLDRSKVIADRLEDNKKSVALLEQKIKEELEEKDIKKQGKLFRSVLESYPLLEDATEKNLVLKSIISKITYSKSKEQKMRDFDLEIDFKF